VYKITSNYPQEGICTPISADPYEINATGKKTSHVMKPVIA
jgi:hypothetical protein